MRRRGDGQSRRREPGQAVVEFALAITVFLVILMGIVDLGRGIYMYNGVSQAAREIARVTSVHPGTTLGNSPETAEVIAIQKRLIPNLQDPTFTCVDIDGSAIATSCVAGNQVKVVIVAPYSPITPLLGLTGTWNLQSTSSVAIQ
jgi:Flp pilus assembly protein TadG